MSTNPGVTTKLVASITWLGFPEKFPIAAIIPSLIAISPGFDLAPDPSTKVPFLIIMSNHLFLCLSHP